MKTRKNFILLLAVVPVVIALAGCAQPKNAKKANDLKAAAAAGQVQPTNPQPTVLQGGWVGPCTDNKDGTSNDTGYVFNGNAYFEQQTKYTASNDCEESDDGSDAQNTNTTGYFTLTQGSGGNGLSQITLTPSFGVLGTLPTYNSTGSSTLSGAEYNVFRKDGNGILWMGTPSYTPGQFPTQANLEFDSWDNFLPTTNN